MFIRLFQFKIKPDELNNLKEFFKTTVFPRFEEQQGCLLAALISGEPNENEFVSVTFWDSDQNAENFEKSGVFKDLFTQIRPILSESSEWELQLSDKIELEYVPAPEEPVIKKYDVKYSGDNKESIQLKSYDMFIRIVSLKIVRNKIDEFKDIFFQKILPAIKESEGCKYVFLTENVNDKNEFLSVSLWENRFFAEEYESSGKYHDLLNLLQETLSHHVLWKMTLQEEFSRRIKTSEDVNNAAYGLIKGKELS